MADDVAGGYAGGILAAARAEGVADRVADELLAFAQALAGHAQLRERLTDAAVPVAAKLDATADLLARAHPQTQAAVTWLIAAGRLRQVEDVADHLKTLVAETRGAAVAEVRTALPLSDDQQRRIADVLSHRFGRPIELKVVVDPELVGGVTVRVGDTVIDGSLARRLEAARVALVGA